MTSGAIKHDVIHNSSLHPGKLIRPQMNESTAAQLVRRLYRLEPIHVTELPSYDDRNYRVIVAPDDSLHGNHIDGYLLKVLNSRDSQLRHVYGQHEMMRVLAEHSINCPQPVKNVFGDDMSLQLVDDVISNDPSAKHVKSQKHIVRLLTFVPGELLGSKPYTPQLLYHFGKFVASIDRALQRLRHPALENHYSIWKMSSTVDLRQFTFIIQDEHRKQLVDDVIVAFKTHVLPKEHNFGQGVIHGDLNESNVLVQSTPNGDTQFVGVIDFGDSSWSPRVYEVAIAISYAMLRCTEIDPLEVGGHILAGYLDDEPLLGKMELSVLRTCVAARLAMTLTMGAYTHSLDPTNSYLLTTATRGWTMLERLWRETSEAELYAGWDAVIRNSYGKTFF